LCDLDSASQQISAISSDYPADNIDITSSRSFSFSKGSGTPNRLHTLQVTVTDANNERIELLVLMSVDEACGGPAGNCTGTLLYCVAPGDTLTVGLANYCNLNAENQFIVNVTGFDNDDLVDYMGNTISYAPVDEAEGTIVPITVILADDPNANLENIDAFDSATINIIYCVSSTCRRGEHDDNADCENINGSFESFSSPVSEDNNWINNELTNWYVSHGTPSPYAGGTENNQVTMWMWSYNEGAAANSNGEGVYSIHNFIKGNEYELTFDLLMNANANPAATFRLELARGLTPGSGETAIPVVENSQRVLNLSWEFDQKQRKVRLKFIADDNYSQLWFYPYLNGAPIPGQAEAQIDNVCLENITVDPNCPDNTIISCTKPATPITICLDDYTRGDDCIDYQNLTGITVSERQTSGTLQVSSNTCFIYMPAIENSSSIIAVDATDAAGNSKTIKVEILISPLCPSAPNLSPKISGNNPAIKHNKTAKPAKKRKADLMVRLNTGNGFANEVISWTGAEQIRAGESLGTSANAAFTGCIPIPIPFITIKICVNPQVNVSWGLQKETQQIRDVDGDGYPDYLTSESDNQMDVKRSTIARTNKLRKVTRPLGAHFTLDYQRYGNTFDHPNDVWALSEVEINDGFAPVTPDGEDYDGADIMLNTFTYEDGYYQRCEREFYGFKKTIINQHDTENNDAIYRTVTREFYNNDDEVNGWEGYFIKGLLLKEMLTDANGALFIETINQYDLKPARAEGSHFPTIARMDNNYYEGGTTPKNTYMTYGYDDLGNVTDYYDNGDGDNALTTVVTYHAERGDNYVVGSPESIIVTGEGAYRERETDIDVRGNVTEVREFISDTTMAVYNMAYDPENGNLTDMTRPENHKGERMFFNYTYDNEVKTYLTGISDAYSYNYSVTYDYRFGIALTTTDSNGNIVSNDIDAKGRIMNEFGPLESTDNIPLMQFDYHPEAEPPYATTLHYDPSNPDNYIESITFIDGLKRATQIKKDADIFINSGQPDEEMMIVSGRLIFDALGRTKANYYPITESLEENTVFNKNFDDITPATTSHDILDRVLKATLPDAVAATANYSIATDGNMTWLSTRITDANGIWKQNLIDIRGLIREVEQQHSEGENIISSYTYNAINEIITSTDGDNNTITFDYDWLGRRTLSNHPDGGETKFIYDHANNLTQKITANLAITEEAIEYEYDYERIINITYPLFPKNNVTYTYGNTGENFNVTGRIATQQDATGSQEFRYNKLGALIFNRRIVNVDECITIDFTTEWEYDTWNRIKSITYPGTEGARETVNYQYNKGGLLQSMKGATNYIERLSFDEFEDRVYLQYGNGTECAYTYEPERRRLEAMIAKTAGNTTFMDCSYKYDALTNITNIQNMATGQRLGSNTNYTYEYDDLYRLIGATGTHDGNNDSYNLTMSYTQSHSIANKTQSHIVDGEVMTANTYDNTYAYDSNKPHAPTAVGNFTYTYDANGNMTNRTTSVEDQTRDFVWDEENRLDHIVENGTTFQYVYDDNGARVIKHSGPVGRVALNGLQQNTIINKRNSKNYQGNETISKQNTHPPCLDEYTVYVNPFIVVRNGTVTKHIYMENERICSKLVGVLEDDGVNFSEPNDAPVYYYHTDHLGSTSYMTDNAGELSQHLEYLPFGEVFVEEDNNPYQTPYLFNAKELDEETGLYYYGARYYDPKLSNWLSVDPLADQYPSWSPYNYTINNPIIYVDPNGETWYENINTKEIVWFTGNKELAGYKHLGPTYEIKDADANITFYDADGTIYFNGKVIRRSLDYINYVNNPPVINGVNKVIGFLVEDFIGGTVSGTVEALQIIPSYFYAAVKGVVQNAGKTYDMESLDIDVNLGGLWEFKNGKWVKTVDGYTEAEGIEAGVSLMPTPIKYGAINKGKKFTETIPGTVIPPAYQQIPKIVDDNKKDKNGKKYGCNDGCD